MHAELPGEHLAYALPQAPPEVPSPPTAGEWTIGIAFVLAALATVVAIAWVLIALPA